MKNDFKIEKFNGKYSNDIIEFLEKCLPESERHLDLEGRHRVYLNIDENFDHFWCMLEGKSIIGTAALKRRDEKRCELKSLYLLKKYQGRGFGKKLLDTVLKRAREEGFAEMYLDTLKSSERAVALYKKNGFVVTERYNDNMFADIFMVLKL